MLRSKECQEMISWERHSCGKL